MKRYIIIAVLLLQAAGVSAQSLDRTIGSRLSDFFANYTSTDINLGRCKVDKWTVNHQAKQLTIYANSTFGEQLFSPGIVSSIYKSLKDVLPGPVNYYDIKIVAGGLPIDSLIPNSERKDPISNRLYTDIKEGKQSPWVECISRQYSASRGLEGRHISVWASHGRYYNNVRGQWQWQRPKLYGTTEDLLTQSFVVPYLIPMLENAGAVVVTPRERDWQMHEVIVDNDNNLGSKGTYLEHATQTYTWQTTQHPGFAHHQATYTEEQNPFTSGTARSIPTSSRSDRASAEWIPNIPEKGRYAVYVSYQTLPESVTDAHYLVYHNGGVTEFRVNQKMGGGTWVYLGTFEFDQGANDYGMVVLNNSSSEKGVITADAVRFGGGMGNIVRGGTTSGLPRFLEGARYYAQWAGMPYNVYSKSEGTIDYNDDINARSLMTNFLSGGSVYNPLDSGLNVPIELTLGLHTDAGYTTDGSIFGSLGIIRTDWQNGLLGSGISRYASRDLADMMLRGLRRDIQSEFAVQWKLRGIWDRNYSEARLPQTPSMILELLAHQNFADMRMAYDPKFQFTVGRSIYKTILKYLATMHSTDYVVQPLPVSHFAISEGHRKNTFELRWTPTPDRLEPSARATGYVVYTRVGYGGFDNGTYVSEPHFTFKAIPGLVYSFRVTAVNRGGQSFPSEILSAYKAPNSHGTILIVNAFHKLSGPSVISSRDSTGFDILRNPGLPYGRTASLIGPQLSFDTDQIGKETGNGLGVSSPAWEGRILAGNTSDYTFIHGKAIQAAGNYSFVSCSDETVESGTTVLGSYFAVDLLMGADDKGFSSEMQRALTAYTAHGGRLLISGSAIGSQRHESAASALFTGQVLKYTSATALRQYHPDEIEGALLKFRISSEPDSVFYTFPAAETIIPLGGSQPVFVYADTRHSAGILWKGHYRLMVLGFPFESITTTKARTALMQATLRFFNE